MFPVIQLAALEIPSQNNSNTPDPSAAFANNFSSSPQPNDAVCTGCLLVSPERLWTGPFEAAHRRFVLLWSLSVVVKELRNVRQLPKSAPAVRWLNG